MIEDMTVRNFAEKTRNDYIRQVKTFTAFLGRSPDTATAEDLRRFQLHQTSSGVRAPSMNSSVAALRFFYGVTLDQPSLARHLTFVGEPGKIPVICSGAWRNLHFGQRLRSDSKQAVAVLRVTRRTSFEEHPS